MRPLFQTRFPRFYRKRSGDRDVSARATHLKAAMENVFMTTTERKRMSTKTTFKRIALVAVAALGLGTFVATPSNAYYGVKPTTTLSVSSTAVSATVGETASVTATIQMVAGGTTDSIAVFTTLAKPTGSSQGLAQLRATTDSANVTQTNHLDFIKSQIVGYSDTVTISPTGLGVTAKATYQVNLVNLDVAGTYTLNVIVSDATKTEVFSSQAVTITVAAENVVPSATYSWAQIVGGTTSVRPDGTADSAVVAAPGTVGATGSVVASIWVYQYNSDSSVTTARGTRVGESVTATLVSGPGQLSLNGSTSGALTVTAGPGDTITVLSDGRSGTASIRLGTTTLGSSWVTKTVKFFGEMTQFTATLPNSTANNTVALSAGTATLKVYPKDVDGNLVTSDAKHGIYLTASDTKVINLNNTKCTFTVAGGYVSCTLTLADSGTTTITVRDSATVASSAFSVTTAALTVAGAAYKGTITTDKSSYAQGEAMKFTVTAKDVYDRVVVDGAVTPFGTVYFAGAKPTFGDDGSANAAGGHFSDLVSYLNTPSTSFVSGSDTMMAFAPTTAGTYTLKGTLNGLADQTLLTFTVVDPTKDAADAATDAALEATDAAYAAQDAAQLAAEAADAATAAAEAATAAVEDLATQVASLFADLQKQITTLANVVAKIAKKVKA